jgi:hypothetical protein
MPLTRIRTIIAYVTLVTGAAGLLATGADHLDEYAHGFSTVPTIGTLFLLNFLAATLVGAALLVPWNYLAKSRAAQIRALLALGGIGIAGMSLIGLWISETSSLFGFTDNGFRPTIVAAIIAESITVVALTAYLATASVGAVHRPRQLRSH